MSQRAAKPCAKPGCAALATAPARYCDDHVSMERCERQQHDRFRGTAAQRGYDHRWAIARQQALRRDYYLCVLCQREGRITSAVDVDHIVPLAVASDRRLDVSNLQSLCRMHHQRKTAEDQRQYGTAVAT